MRRSLRIWCWLWLAVLSASCKQPPIEGKSTLKDLNPSRPSGYVPGTHLVLKDSIKRLFSGITLVNSGMQDGAHVYTVTKINFSRFASNTNGVTAKILMDISVDAKKSSYIALGVSGGAMLSFAGTAEVTIGVSLNGQAVTLAYQGIEWVRPLNVHDIKTSTNAAIWPGLVHKGARKKAMAAVPSTIQAIKSEVVKQITSGINNKSPEFQKYIADASRAIYDVPGAIPRLASDNEGVYFQHHFKAAGSTQVTNPPTTPLTVDTGVVYHEQTFTQLLSPNLAGKTINVNDLGEVICKSFSRSLYKMCTGKKENAPVDIEMVFDQRSPVDFKFLNGELSLELNFAIRMVSNERTLGYLQSLVKKGTDAFKLAETTDKTTEPGTKLESDDGELKVGHQIPTMNVNVRFKLDNRRLIRQEPEVKVNSAPDVGGEMTQSQAYRQGLIMLFKSQIKKYLPSEISIPALPTYASSDSRVKNFGGGLVVMNPAHFGIRDNWLFTYFTYCAASDTQTSLGVNFQNIDVQGGYKRIKLTSVTAGSPAAKGRVVNFSYFQNNSEVEMDYKPAAGLQIGDIVYSVDGRDEILGAPELFSGYLAGKSLTPDNTVKLTIGRLEAFPGLEDKVWMKIDYEVQLQKTCRKAT